MIWSDIDVMWYDIKTWYDMICYDIDVMWYDIITWYDIIWYCEGEVGES